MCDSMFLKLEIKQRFLMISNYTFVVQQYSLGLKATLKLEIKMNALRDNWILLQCIFIICDSMFFEAGNQTNVFNDFDFYSCSATVLSGTQGIVKARIQIE